MTPNNGGNQVFVHVSDL
ncbi:hypothetical protein [Flavobacterium johnsoniae]|nr:hypothetical protein B0A63_24940 [Flavobacterium johnsoniae UW101]